LWVCILSVVRLQGYKVTLTAQVKKVSDHNFITDIRFQITRKISSPPWDDMPHAFLFWSIANAMVTNKTDIVRFAHHRRISLSLGHRTILKYFLLRGHISYGRRLTSVYDNIGRSPAELRTVSGWRCIRSAGHRMVTGRFYTNLHVQ